MDQIDLWGVVKAVFPKKAAEVVKAIEKIRFPNRVIFLMPSFSTPENILCLPFRSLKRALISHRCFERSRYLLTPKSLSKQESETSGRKRPSHIARQRRLIIAFLLRRTNIGLNS